MNPTRGAGSVLPRQTLRIKNGSHKLTPFIYLAYGVDSLQEKVICVEENAVLEKDLKLPRRYHRSSLKKRPQAVWSVVRTLKCQKGRLIDNDSCESVA